MWQESLTDENFRKFAKKKVKFLPVVGRLLFVCVAVRILAVETLFKLSPDCKICERLILPPKDSC